MEKLKHFINHFEENVITVLLPVMCVLVFIATFCRHLGIMATPWSEELPRYIMIWMVLLGASACSRNDAHFAVRAFADRLKGRAATVLYIFTKAYVLIFYLVTAYFSGKILLVQYQMGAISTVLGIPMYLIYLSIPVGSILCFAREVQNIVEHFRKAPVAKEEGAE